MTSNDNEDAVQEHSTAGEREDLPRRLDELEDSIIAERDDAGVPGRVTERENIEQAEPDNQAPA